MLDERIGVLLCANIHGVGCCVLSLDGTCVLFSNCWWGEPFFLMRYIWLMLCAFIFFMPLRDGWCCASSGGFIFLQLFAWPFFFYTWLCVTSAGMYGSVRSSSCDEMSMYVSVLPTCRHCRLPRDALCGYVHCLHRLTSFQMLSLPTETWKYYNFKI